MSGETTVNEAEWFQHRTDPERMLRFLQGKPGARKLRLFAVACCRFMLRTVSIRAISDRQIVVAERYADSTASLHELQEAGSYYCNSVAEHACSNATEDEAGIVMADCAALNAAWGATQPGNVMPNDGGVSEARLVAEQAIQCDLLRDIIGNPFRPVRVAPTWLAWYDGLVIRLAQAAYDERQLPTGTLDNGRLAILADALEEAGCTDADILTHLRSPGPHVRGCWVLDLCLGKS